MSFARDGSGMKPALCSATGLILCVVVAAVGLYCLCTVTAETELDREKAGHSYFQTKASPRP